MFWKENFLFKLIINYCRNGSLFLFLNGIADSGAGAPFPTKIYACAVLSIQFFKRITDTLYFFEEGFIEVGLLIVLRHNEEVFAP